MNTTERWVSIVLLAIALATSGCNTPVGVRRVSPDRAYEQVTSQALNRDEPSHYSIRAISTYGLQERFDVDPKGTLAQLFEHARLDTNSNAVFALAELSYLVAEAQDDQRYFLASAFYAYAYLFHPRIAAIRHPFDPRFRIACDLYNRALTEALRTPKGEFRFRAGFRALPFGTLTLTTDRRGFPWSEKAFGRLLPASDFLVRGLRGRFRQAGLGVPLIAVRTEDAATGGPTHYLRGDAKVAATAFLRFDLSRDAILSGRLHGVLELYAPFQTSSVRVGEEGVPLEADFTAPLAYLLQEGRLFGFELSGFFSGDQAARDLGLFMLHPYQPGKIPIVFVHGTASSPARWAEMFNSLQSSPQLRDKVQFVFFQYATGNPILYSAHLLRNALRDFVQTLDPAGEDPALRRMVVIGHSQGGLLTRLIGSASGDRAWQLISDTPFESFKLPEKQKAVLRDIVFFEPLPFVERLIFIATPHRGSFHSGTWYGRLAGSLVSFPRRLTAITKDLLAHDPDGTLKKQLADNYPSSVRGMDPDGPFVKLLDRMPPDPSVTCHSIIPIAGAGTIRDENDGVVEYVSAHLDGVASEFLVHSPHSCQSNPLTIIEVRRILTEHLANPTR